MKTLILTLVVEEREGAIRRAMIEERMRWAASDAVATAMGGLMDRSEFPNAVAGGTAELVLDSTPLCIEVPIEVDAASQSLLDLLRLGFSPDDPLIGEINGELQAAVGVDDLQVDLVSIRVV